MRTRALSPGRLGRLTLGVLVAHLLLLRGLDAALDALDRAAPAHRPVATFTVRAVAAAPPLIEAPPVAMAAPMPSVADDASTSMAAPRAAQARAARGVPAAELSAVLIAPPPGARAKGVPRAGAPTDAPAPEVPVPDVPVYRTIVPPPFAAAYELRRGGRSGSAELSWQAQGAQYSARLSGAIDGKPWWVAESVGSLDAAGLAPLRHTDRRVGRSALAVNFQREAGKVTFSGPSIEHALVPGMQDGLSWLLQLTAIARADPSLVGPGGRVRLRVAGVRGEADVWTFVRVGEERLGLADGEATAVHLLREPGQAYDARVEVWLDPARHFLPVRVRWGNAAAAETLQLELRAVVLAAEGAVPAR